MVSPSLSAHRLPQPVAVLLNSAFLRWAWNRLVPAVRLHRLLDVQPVVFDQLLLTAPWSPQWLVKVRDSAQFLEAVGITRQGSFIVGS